MNRIGFSSIVLLFGLAGCSKLEVPAEVQQAIGRSRDLAATFPFQRAAGSMAGLWDALPLRFPEVKALVEGKQDTGAALQARLEGTPPLDEDASLAITAYALAQRKDSSAIQALQGFLERNIWAGHDLAPHFATRALYSLSGRGDPSLGSYWYRASEMRAVMAGGQALISTSAEALTQRAVCDRSYLLVDASGNALDFFDKEKGARVPAVVGGKEIASDYLPKITADGFVNDVTKGEGTYVEGSAATEDAGFVGRPSPKFNCGGYAFRKLNGGRPWRGDPSRWWRVLSGVGAIEVVPQGEAIEPGHLVFYFRPNTPHPGHVAVVQRVPSPGQVIVRNADGHSGLWEAAIDAKYFFPEGPGSTEAQRNSQYQRREVYRWKGGVMPKFIVDPDPAYAASPDNCANEPKDPNAKPNACPVGQSLCVWCMDPTSGSAWLGEMLASWEEATRLRQLRVTASNPTSKEKVSWVVSMTQDASGKWVPFKAKLTTVTHDLIKGTSPGEGNVYFGDSLAYPIESSTFSFAFNDRSVTGKIEIAASQGKQVTLDVAGHLEGSCKGY